MNPKTNFRNFLIAKGFSEGHTAYQSPSTKYGEGVSVRLNSVSADVMNNATGNIKTISYNDFSTFKNEVA